MVGIHGADRGLQPAIERSDQVAVRVTGLVERVVPRDPGVSPVPVGDRLPQVHDAVLEMTVSPERRPLCRVVTVPVLILGTWSSMKVEDGEDALIGAGLDHPIEKLEPLLLDDHRRIVVLEMPVVEGDTERVDAQSREERRVLVGEEHVQKSREESLVALVSEHTTHCPTMLGLRACVAGDEVLHVHPAAESEPVQGQRAVGTDDAIPIDVEDGTVGAAHLRVTAVQDTGGRMMRNRPSTSRAVSFGLSFTRSGSARVFAACMSASYRLSALPRVTSPRWLVSTTNSTASSRLRLTRKTAVSPVSSTWVATASTSPTVP